MLTRGDLAQPVGHQALWLAEALQHIIEPADQYTD
jgi:hypothetical protein